MCSLASSGDSRIAWYENTNGDGSSWSAQTISYGVLSALSVFAADVDGDGDLDALSASFNDNKIAWYENTDGAGNFGSQQVISTMAVGPFSVFAADTDRDGDIDVLSASFTDSTIAWYENTDGQGSFGAQQVISDAALNAVSVFAADIDGDGDIDALSASRYDDKIAWYENQGGQFALATANTAPTTIDEGQEDDLLRIAMTHRGRAGDSDTELVSLNLRFQRTGGGGSVVPLKMGEANAIIDELRLYLDDGDGNFETNGDDTLVKTFLTLNLDENGEIIFPVRDDTAEASVPFGTPSTFFLSTLLTADAFSQSVSNFKVTHLTESTSTGEDTAEDISISLEFADNTTSSKVFLLDLPPVFFVRELPRHYIPGDTFRVSLFVFGAPGALI